MSLKLRALLLVAVVALSNCGNSDEDATKPTSSSSTSNPTSTTMGAADGGGGGGGGSVNKSTTTTRGASSGSVTTISPSGSSGSTTTAADGGGGGQSTTTTTFPRGQWTATATASKSCVAPGGVQTVNVKARAGNVITYIVKYADEESHNNSGGGVADSRGRYADNFVVSLQAPPGPAAIIVTASDREKGVAFAEARFTVGC